MVSYLTLRRAIGFLGIALPVALALWGFALTDPPRLLDSMSDYYSLRTRDVFVGALWTIGWFLFAYKGYDDHDDRVTDLGCVLALAVSLAPNTGPGMVSTIHFASAGGLFLVLAHISYFLFTKTDGTRTMMKEKRDTVYRGCGIAMVSFVVLIALYKLLGEPPALARLKPVFWLEALTLWAFGLSWMVKGETLWRDA